MYTRFGAIRGAGRPAADGGAKPLDPHVAAGPMLGLHEHSHDSGGAVRGFWQLRPRRSYGRSTPALGGTEESAESQRTTAAYTKEDWLRIQTSASRHQDGLVALMKAGVAADSPEAMNLAEEHRLHISRWFDDCGYDMHRGLGEMYAADPRFAAHYEGVAPGLAIYLRDAIFANADQRHAAVRSRRLRDASLLRSKPAHAHGSPSRWHAQHN